MKAIIGEAPLLPWWRVATMSDAEIQEFNSRFYVEVEMTDDSLDDTQQSSVGISKGPDDCAEYMLLQARQKGQEQWTNIYAAQLGQFISYGCEVRAITNDDVWNAAIEAAAACVELTSKFGEMGRMAEEIRKLKK